MEPEGSLQYLQEPDMGFQSKPDESSLTPLILLL
jgi:hypothetical protein